MSLPNETLLDAYRAMTPGSAALAERARGLMPGGLTHDSRHFDPYPLYVARAEGPLKWDVDGNRYVDYFGGHGSLLFGHNHPTIAAAVREAFARGTHFGACHETEVLWAELVTSLIPSAELVRFTNSGTEATLMALRLARAFTGRSKIVRFRGHFHGWHDHMASGYSNHFDGSAAAGVIEGIADQVLLADPNDTAGIDRLFSDHKDIAALILEPTGAGFGKMPLLPSFVRHLRDVTKAAGTLLVFDEVVTGFRVSPGGAQQVLDVMPDLTTLAKVLAGGLPGGAVCGRKDVLDLLDFHLTKAAGREKIGHQGTFNANPVSAAAGVAALTLVRDGAACAKANDYAATLRTRMNVILDEESVSWAVYGSYSGLHIFANPDGASIERSHFDAIPFIPRMLDKSRHDGMPARIRMGLLVNGVDVNTGPSGWVSAVHGEDEMETTVAAFRATVRAIKREGGN